MPTYERRLTPIKNIHINDVETKNVEFISRILAQKELPVENVFLENVSSDTIQQALNIHENVLNFRYGLK